MGAGDLNHRQFAQQVDLYTSGLSVSSHICAHHSNELGYEQVIVCIYLFIYVSVLYSEKISKD